MMMAKTGSYVAAAAVLITAIAKFMQGEMPNMTEIMLAVGVLAAAFGFQKSA